MRYTNLGGTGLKVSRICLGMMSYGSPNWAGWALSEDEARAHVRKAVELGINFFDTADGYSAGASEEITGRLIKETGIPRDDTVIATKVYFPTGERPNQRGLSKKHIHHAIDNSLKRLGVDYIDLYQIHRLDPYTPIEETLDALDSVVKAGKALYLGASSMFAWQFMKLMALQRHNHWTRFRTMQNHYNLIYREEEREMIPLCQSEGVGVIPWSPLARGFLAGNRKREGGGDTKRSTSDPVAQIMYRSDDFDVVDAVSAVAQRRGAPNAQIALAWMLNRPGITAPIIGATKLHHIEDAAAAVDLKLDADEMKALEAPYKPHPVLGHTYGDAAEEMARARRAMQQPPR